MDLWSAALLVATGVHLGLELVVHLVVYPALASGSTAEPGLALARHRAHARQMSLAVAPVYGGLALASAGAVLTSATPLHLLVLVLVVVTFAVTGFAAVPLHEGLQRPVTTEDRARGHRRLALVDLVRLVLAVALVVLAVAAVL